jgi:hypothetical protein
VLVAGADLPAPALRGQRPQLAAGTCSVSGRADRGGGIIAGIRPIRPPLIGLSVGMTWKPLPDVPALEYLGIVAVVSRLPPAVPVGIVAKSLCQRYKPSNKTKQAVA